MEQRVITPKELMKKLELYSVPVKDIKGNIDYFMISSSLYKEIWWGLMKMQKQMDNQEREKVINDGQCESADNAAGSPAGGEGQAARSV